MDAQFTEEDEAFRAEIAGWLEAHLCGEFEIVKGRGGPGDEHALFEERHACERKLGADGWIGVGWPKEVGGRDLSLNQQVIQRFALSQSCLECSGLVLERAIAQRLVLSLKGIDGLNLRLKAAQVLGISIAEDSFCEALKHDVCRPKEMFTCLTGCR